MLWNGGAYADIGPRVTQKSGFTAAGPYDIDNVAINSYELYTNRPPAGALRGFGIPQLVWAYESHTDLVARKLGIDPIEFRRRNILRDGRPQATGTAMRDAAIGAVLDALAARMNWSAPFDRGTGTVRRGRGVAIGFKASISPTTSVAIVTVSADGSVALSMNTVDMGQGADTAMALIVAEVLGIAAEEVRVVLPDTDVTPYDMGTLGSRSTFHMGHAVRLAATDARTRLAALAAEAGLPPGTNYPAAEIFRKRYGMQAGNVVGTGTYIPSYAPPDAAGLSADVTPFWMVGAAGAEVEVDTETGHVRVTRLVNVADAGTPLNPAVAVEPALRRGDHAARLHPAGEDGVRRRASHQRLARRLQDPRHPRRAADGGRARRLGTDERSVRRQGARRIRHLRRLAGDRQRDPRRRRRAAHRIADEAGSGAAGDPRRAGPAAGGGVAPSRVTRAWVAPLPAAGRGSCDAAVLKQFTRECDNLKSEA